MPPSFTERIVEKAAIARFTDLGYTYLHGPEIAPDQPASERATYSDVVLVERNHYVCANLDGCAR